MVPKVLRGRPSAALAAAVYGYELGPSPMTSLREVFTSSTAPCRARPA